MNIKEAIVLGLVIMICIRFSWLAIVGLAALSVLLFVGMILVLRDRLEERRVNRILGIRPLKAPFKGRAECYEMAETIKKRENEERIKEGQWQRKFRENEERFVRQIIEYQRRTGKQFGILDNPRKLTEAGIPPDWNG
jgi:hypothetical protein